MKRHPIIDPALCTGCGRCVEVCCNKVYQMASERAEVKRPEDCCGTGHDFCAKKCPAGAITFEGEPSGDGCACNCDCGTGGKCCG